MNIRLLFVFFYLHSLNIGLAHHSTAQRGIIFILSAVHSFSLNMAKRLDYLGERI